jgi:hypothetical protein
MNDKEDNLNTNSQMPDDGALDRLIYAYLEGTLNPKDAVILTGYLKDPRCVQYFVERCKQEQVLYDLISSNSQQQADASCSFESGIWQELARYEYHAPAVPYEKASKEISVPQETSPKTTVRKTSKTSIFSLYAAAAAIILIFVFAYFSPPETGIKVAVLSDSIHAKWADTDGIMENGVSIFTSRKNLFLQEGYAKFLYDNQMQITIEGPAEFQILAEDRINLRYGKIYAAVPSKAIGFMVTTQSAKVIDLGTEFGVWTSLDGSTELHVYKGKTTLIAGVSQDSKQVAEVVAGKAKRTWTSNSHIEDISLEETLFARDIDSSKQFVWHGKPLSLASLVAGGDGFTRRQVSSGIDPATGKVHLELVQKEGRLGKNAYMSVQDRPCIDGVFVPSGSQDPTVVSSAGHTFAFPQTDTVYYSDITSNPYAHKLYPESDIALSLRPLAAGKTADSSLIFLHSNAGITFNLDKIRQSFGHLEIDRFKSSCGISQGTGEINRSEFWVLIDGQSVFHNTLDRNHSEVMEINILITPEQKFLTLATTDGGDTPNMDWCMFENPRVELVKKQKEVDKTDHDAGMKK